MLRPFVDTYLYRIYAANGYPDIGIRSLTCRGSDATVWIFSVLFSCILFLERCDSHSKTDIELFLVKR